MPASLNPAPDPPRFAAVRVICTPQPGGGALLRAAEPLGPYGPSLGHLLHRAVACAPDRVFLGERLPDGAWRTLTYAAALQAAEAVAQALLDRGLCPARPVLVLSGNSIDHALLMLGAFLAGVPVVPVSAAYSLSSQDHHKLRAIFALVRPGLVYVAEGPPFARALAALDLHGVEVVTSGAAPPALAATPLQALLDRRPAGVAAALAGVGPETVAKVLFTSGSTGEPKGVINTHGMLCANQQMLAQVWPFLADQPPVLLDWLPWSHTFGGNHNFNLVLRHAGTLYLDGGKPASGLIEHTVRNLAEVAPTIYFNVPAGYAALLPYLERDPGLARRFFSRLQLIFYAGAALPQDLWTRLQELAVRTCGRSVVLTSSWGSTETAPLATAAHFVSDRAGNIGVPVPGVELKLVPAGDKLELRVRGPNVTPGYLSRPDLTAAAFDEEGYYRIGDAGRLVDPADPGRGLLFDGRVAEDFKLATGTWVSVGALRVTVLAAAAPLLLDAVIAGHDRSFVGVLAWLNLAALRTCMPALADETDPGRVLADPAVVEHLRRGLRGYNAAHRGSSQRVARLVLLAEPPSIDAGEITDKGYINQRATLARRQAAVAALYTDPPGPGVILIEDAPPVAGAAGPGCG